MFFSIILLITTVNIKIRPSISEMLQRLDMQLKHAYILKLQLVHIYKYLHKVCQFEG